METIIYILASIGLTFIITRSYIFQNIREKIAINSEILGTLFSCPQCMGFWSGLLITIPTLSLTTMILTALSTSGVCYILTKNEE